MQKCIKVKDLSKIAEEWDQIAPLRDRAITLGEDISFDKVLTPAIINEIRECDKNFVVDCGCGTGCLAERISKDAVFVEGVDISKKSIEIAREKFKNNNNMNFVNMSLEEYAENNERTATVCVANMLLMDVLDLKGTLEAIYRIMKKEASLILMITHPCYWPIYWGYFDEPWFQYEKEIVIEAEFSISKHKKMGVSTLVHRPLSQYTDALLEVGFHLEKIREPYPKMDEAIEDYEYVFPRFLCMVCRK